MTLPISTGKLNDAKEAGAGQVGCAGGRGFVEGQMGSAMIYPGAGEKPGQQPGIAPAPIVAQDLKGAALVGDKPAAWLDLYVPDGRLHTGELEGVGLAAQPFERPQKRGVLIGRNHAAGADVFHGQDLGWAAGGLHLWWGMELAC